MRVRYRTCEHGTEVKITKKGSGINTVYQTTILVDAGCDCHWESPRVVSELWRTKPS